MRVRHLPLVFAAAALGSFAPAHAQEGAAPDPAPAPSETPAAAAQVLTHPAQISVAADGKTIFVVGDIGAGSFVAFARALRANPRVDTVALASPGGLVLEGYLMGNAVRTRNLATRVDYVCSSSCTSIFASGGQRLLGPNGRIGFHQTYQMDDAGQVISAQNYRAKNRAIETTLQQGETFGLTTTGDSQMVRAMRRAGVSDLFIARVLRTPPGEMWYPEASELLREGMVTRLAEAALPGQLPPDARSLEQVTAAASANSFWSALAERRPEQFAEAALTLWRNLNSGMPEEEAEMTARTPVEQELFPEIASASDALAAQFLALFAADSRLQRELGYPNCPAPPEPARVQPDPKLGDLRGQAITPVDPRFAELRETNNRLYAELLVSPATVRAPTAEQARRKMLQRARGLFETGLAYQQLNDETDAYYCRENTRLYEATAQLPPRQQLEVFRAIIVLNSEPAADSAE